MVKNKLTLEGQIIHMENKGITFSIVNHEDAIQFLRNSNYYFRVKSYAKNYAKYNTTSKKGQYIGLDFAHLQELSIIDMYLRRILLRMTLDIEHSLKVELIDKMLNSSNDDGYNIVQKFFSVPPGNKIKSNLQKSLHIYREKNSRSYTSNIILKYHPNYPIWNILEVLSFGDFIHLYKFCYKEIGEKTPLQDLLWSAKIIRNATAHNNCLLNNLSTQKTTQISNTLRILLKNDVVSKKLYDKHKKCYVLMDILSVCFLFNRVRKNDSIRQESFIELKEQAIDRLLKSHFFAKNTTIRECFELLDFTINALLSPTNQTCSD